MELQAVCFEDAEQGQNNTPITSEISAPLASGLTIPAQGLHLRGQDPNAGFYRAKTI